MHLVVLVEQWKVLLIPYQCTVRNTVGAIVQSPFILMGVPS